MRDKIIALAMCALLAVTLFACGDDRRPSNDSDVLGDEQHQTGTNNGTANGNSSTNGNTANGNSSTNGTTNNSGTNNSTTGNSNSSNSGSTGTGTDQNVTTGNNAKQSDVMGDSALRGSTINPANGSADRTASWEQMLRNGRARDRDGFLFDGENSHGN